MESDAERSLISHEKANISWYRRLLCCYKPAEDPRVAVRQLTDIPSPSSITEERRPQLRYPILDYAAERVYLMGRGMNKVFAMIHHVNLTEDQVHLTDARPNTNEALPRALWKKRMDLFSKFDEGVKVDVSTWKDCIYERVAKVIAKRCKNEKVFDAFCGSGSNAIQFARHCQVIALDLDPLKIEYAKHNAALYGVGGKVSFFQGDFMILADQINADVVFLDLPKVGAIDPEDCNLTELFCNPPLIDVLHKAQKHAKSIMMYLPKEVNLDEVAWLVKEHTPFECAVELDVFYLRGDILGICLVVGAIASLPQKDVLRLTASRLNLKDSEELKVLESILAVAGLRKVVDLLASVDALSSISATRISEERITTSKAASFFELARDDPDVAWETVIRKSSEDVEPAPDAPVQPTYLSGIIRIHSVEGGDALSDIIRMLLLYKGLKFVDHRIVLGKYDPVRQTELSEFGLWPVCEFGDKKMAQTKPITRFLAHVFGFYPEDKAHAYWVESLCDYVVDAHSSIEQAEDRKEAVITAVRLIAKRIVMMTGVKISLHDFYVVWLLSRWKDDLPSELPVSLARLWEHLTSGSLSAFSK